MTTITTENMAQFVSPVWSPPEVSRDTHHIGRGLWATYKCSEFNHQVIPGRFVEAFTDEYVELFCVIGCDRTFELIRKPPTSKVELKGTRVVFGDVPGLYCVRIVLERAFEQTVRIACFPRAAEKYLGYSDRHAAQRRLQLRAICRDDRVSDATIIDSLESDDPMFGLSGRIVGCGRPIEQGSGASGDQTFSVGSYNA